MTDLNFLTPKEISREYNLPITTVRELLNITVNPCPLVRGRNGKRFIVEKSVFENWIKTKDLSGIMPKDPLMLKRLSLNKQMKKKTHIDKKW